MALQVISVMSYFLVDLKVLDSVTVNQTSKHVSVNILSNSNKENIKDGLYKSKQ